MQDYTVNSIKKALFDPPIGKVSAALEYSDADLDWADENNLRKNALCIEARDGIGIITMSK